MRLTAIIATYNRPASLRRALESVFVLDPPPDELLVVDQSEQRDAGLGDLLDAAPFPGARLLVQERPNAQTARNRAARESSGQLLLFLDDDVIVEPDLIGAHRKNYDDPSIDAVGGFFLEPGESPTDRLPPEYLRPYTGWIHLPHGYTRRCESGLFPSCNGSIRREALFRCGGFDENYTRTLLDDTDLSCRLRAIGARIVHDPLARALHLKEATGGKRPGGIDDRVIADASTWRTWTYFFLLNFGSRGWREIAVRFRRCVLRKVNLTHPPSLARATAAFISGATQAARMIQSGRRLPLPPNPGPA